ncbi:hypothetical protein AURDEDRAFT_170823 [Auricularia subglabra TFB-10046 SS5]|nr:hypothetical protein AURDEDRAFT_170823 [Auricularia subglabra TFB-10046 SS5]
MDARIQDGIRPFTLPAPSLETLSAPYRELALSDDFLGGCQGRLQTLELGTVQLPHICPALSNILRLSVTMSDSAAQAAPFGRLFQLCPRLRSLSLSRLRTHHAPLFLDVPAPRMLDTLELDALDLGYDLVQHYTRWRTGDNLRKVSLIMDEVPRNDLDLGSLVSGATRLTWIRDSEDCNTMIIAEFPRNASRDITFPYDREFDSSRGRDLVQHLFENAQQGIRRVHTLQLPAEELAPWLEHRILHGLPNLAYLTLSVADLVQDTRSDWGPLARLRDVRSACPSVVLIVLTLFTFPWQWCGGQPGRDACQELVALLASDATSLPVIELRGFNEDTLRNMPLADINHPHPRVVAVLHVAITLSDWDP